MMGEQGNDLQFNLRIWSMRVIFDDHGPCPEKLKNDWFLDFVLINYRGLLRVLRDEQRFNIIISCGLDVRITVMLFNTHRASGLLIVDEAGIINVRVCVKNPGSKVDMKCMT